jgi:hypothetical protein
MSNLSYCRFRNTLRNLQDIARCFDDELSPEEHAARLKILTIVKDLANYEPDSLPFEIEDEDESDED